MSTVNHLNPCDNDDLQRFNVKDNDKEDIVASDIPPSRPLNENEFFPPLYKHRYSKVCTLLDSEQIKSVIDFGCAECKIFKFMKNSMTLEKILGVDIDEELLTSRLSSIKPSASDYLTKRRHNMSISIYAGDGTMYDNRMKDVDAATLIEIIEHLHEEPLKNLTRNVFEAINPQLVVVTTPNADYNVLFPGFSGMRHWDHKFEWTRIEFQAWCEAVCSTYGYTVTYTGVGDPTPSSQHVGFCSQIGVFKRKGSCQPKVPSGLQDATPYKLLTEVLYTSRYASLDREVQIVQEATYYINIIACDVRTKSYESSDSCTSLPSFEIDSNFEGLTQQFRDSENDFSVLPSQSDPLFKEKSGWVRAYLQNQKPNHKLEHELIASSYETNVDLPSSEQIRHRSEYGGEGLYKIEAKADISDYTDVIHINIDRLIKFPGLGELQVTLDELKMVLVKNGWEISNDGHHIIYKMENQDSDDAGDCNDEELLPQENIEEFAPGDHCPNEDWN